MVAQAITERENEDIKKSGCTHKDRKQPDIFCCTLVIRRSFSARLFVNGTIGFSMKRNTSVSKFISRSNRFRALDRFCRPRLPTCNALSGGGHSTSASANIFR